MRSTALSEQPTFISMLKVHMNWSKHFETQQNGLGNFIGLIFFNRSDFSGTWNRMQRTYALLNCFNIFSFVLSKLKKNQNNKIKHWISLDRMISKAKIPTSRSKLASYSYHLVQYLRVFYKLSLDIFPHFCFWLQSCYLPAPCSQILHEQSEKIKSQWGKRKPASPEYLSPLAFFSDKTEIIDCPTCLQYSRTQFTVKSLNGSDH